MVRIVTDSSSDIPAEVARELQISVVPMYVRFGTEVYRDGVELGTDEFYQKLIASQTVPTTSSPKMKDFSEAYDRLAEETDDLRRMRESGGGCVLRVDRRESDRDETPVTYDAETRRSYPCRRQTGRDNRPALDAADYDRR